MIEGRAPLRSQYNKTIVESIAINEAPQTVVMADERRARGVLGASELGARVSWLAKRNGVIAGCNLFSTERIIVKKSRH